MKVGREHFPIKKVLEKNRDIVINKPCSFTNIPLESFENGSSGQAGSNDT